MRSASRLSRRCFLSGRHTIEPVPLRPPWTDEERIAEACTACGDCISACPQAILSPGPHGFPVLSFAERECTLCGRCAEACAEPVFAQSAGPAFTHLAVVGEACFALRGIHCQTCGDVCLQAAIRFRARLGGPPLPEIAAEACNGCGACAAVCPTQAVAMHPAEAALD
jgi:ferredoxin-type protein NapF